MSREHRRFKRRMARHRWVWRASAPRIPATRLAAAMAWTRHGNPYIPVDPHHEAVVEDYVEAHVVGRKRRPLVRGQAAR